MSDLSPVLGLPYILPAQAQKHVTHNMAIRQLDTLVQLAVQSRATGTPPSSPAPADRYIVGSGAGGDWSGQENAIAFWDGSAWNFTAPAAGWQAHVLDENTTLVFDGGGWDYPTLHLQNLTSLGINTTADSTNRLAVSATASLFNNDGAGHQLKINKAGSADTASVLFQTGWSGRAEIGLAGNDDFSFKISADGSSFDTALTLENDTGFSKAKCLVSGRITIASDSVGYIDTPSAAGFVFVTVVHADFPQIPHSGIFAYDTGSSLFSLPVFTGSLMEDHGSSTLTGTTSTATHSGFAVDTGRLQIENRHTGARVYSYTFIGGV